MPALPDPEEEPTVAVWPDAGQAMGLGRGAAYAAAARGDLPVVKIGGRKLRVSTAALRRMLNLDDAA